jgi:uncharacterized protein (TIGR02145 family)
MKIYLTITIVFASWCFNGFCQQTATFKDSRDGKEYKTIKIGRQWMMAENLAYKPSEGECHAFDNDEKNVAKYGYLYDWATAKKVVPAGWHLPGKLELRELYSFLGDADEKVFASVKENGNSGFNALTVGYYNTTLFIPKVTKFWSATACGPNLAWCFYFNDEQAGLGSDDAAFGFSVRLFKD